MTILLSVIITVLLALLVFSVYLYILFRGLNSKVYDDFTSLYSTTVSHQTQLNSLISSLTSLQKVSSTALQSFKDSTFANFARLSENLTEQALHLNELDSLIQSHLSQWQHLNNSK